MSDHAFIEGPLLATCTHARELHFADNGSRSAGCIHWCPDCGAVSVTLDRSDRKWHRPGAEAVEYYELEGA